ncbi:MAG: type II toxin-antitoxin system RelB/DinJ family antitoxin [Rhodothermales bacterium]|nr:type II toxin-antitoxin system RelB/DinJ family antitoxin [Rhodothermales bacterium]
MMGKTSSISARINATDKERAEAVFRRLGITASQAIALFYKQVYLRRGIPFPVELPNEETVAALEEVRSGGGEAFESTDALFEDLEA